MNSRDTTLEYYNQNAGSFIEGTMSVDVSHLYVVFEEYLSLGAKILDVGCGSGRDLKYFAAQGYRVVGLEPSDTLATYAGEYSGQQVVCKAIQETDWANKFEGIWCCASLLHVPKKELPEVFAILEKALKQSGVIYVSFKYGDSEIERSGRFFTDLNESLLEELVSNCLLLSIKSVWLTGDARPGREDEKWLNAMIVKSV